MKCGLEKEGRLKGLATLFLSAEDFARNRHLTIVSLAKEPELGLLAASVVHIYISDHGNAISYDAPGLLGPSRIRRQITLEVTAVRDRNLYPENVSFILAMQKGTDVESFWSLQQTDQIKFSTGPQGYVYCVTKENMTETVPEDFSGDREIELKERT